MAQIQGIGEAVTKEGFEYLFHHIFLPPKVPGESDDSVENDNHLIDFVLDSLTRFCSEADPARGEAITECIEMIDGMKQSRDASGKLHERGVWNALWQLTSKGGCVTFHIAAQNAGVLVCKTPDSVLFETFEVAPLNIAAMTTKGRLIRNFPANSIEISMQEFKNSDFLTVIAKALVKMSSQTVQEMKQKSIKTGQEHNEDRDTTSPRIVTELLVNILQGIGKPTKSKGISKHTREEVSWNGSKLPWRRSPLWLLIRVSLQLTFLRLTGTSDDLYKPFMAFLMARVLDYGNQHCTSSDILHIMLAKVSQRFCKLLLPCNGMWVQTAERIVSWSSTILAQRWKRIQQDSTKPLDLEELSNQKMEDNIYFSLPKMDEFICSISSRVREGGPPSFRPIPHLRLHSPGKLPSVKITTEEHRPFCLAMIESWVEDHLDKWLQKHLDDKFSCRDLKKLIEKYHSEASAFYADYPEGASRMFLTIGELWVAMDKIAVHTIPMLGEYDAEIPIEVWQALLIASPKDMERLNRVETYIAKRQKDATMTNLPSVFHSFGDALSLPVRYFAQCTAHQDLQRRIERDAWARRQEKIAEFHRLKNKYRSLIREYETNACNFASRVEYGVEVQDHLLGGWEKCRRCFALSTAKQMTILIDEWPLPSDKFEAQATIFELDLPVVFAEWRDATVFLANDVLLGNLEHQELECCYSMRTYRGLFEYYQSGMRRVHLISQTKPYIITHFKEKLVGDSVEDDVCVENGLRYQYYDEKEGTVLSALCPSVGVSSICTFKLPERAKALEPFLMRTWADPNGATPNKTISSQWSCPDYMSTSEFKALTNMRYGYFLGWLNILNQLAMPMVDFNKPETATFLLQMSLQVGPNPDRTTTRCAHTRPSDILFGRRILEKLNDCVMRVKENWESHTSLCSFMFLTTRLLSLVPEDLHNGYLKLLERCREISYEWMLKLIDKVQTTTDDDQRREFSQTVLTIALICAGSFNIEARFLSDILKQSVSASILVEASVIIYNNSSLKVTGANTMQTILFDRWRYTMHRARSLFVLAVEKLESPCFSLAIKRHWPDFERVGDWKMSESTCDWFETTSGNHVVHLNILTGMLLVDGLPLSRLPRDHEQHPEYTRLFGSLVLEVMPSSLPGMRFSTPKSFRGYSVHFGMQNSTQDSSYRGLLVQLKGNGQDLHMIPPSTIDGLLPHTFVHKYIHWYNVDTKIIEFRPIENPWTDSSDNWRFIHHKGGWQLHRHGEISLLAPAGLLTQRIADTLSSLEEPLSLHMLYAVERGALEIQVPRLHLEFLFNSDNSTLRSKQYRGMQVDTDQSLGTLVGLSSKLILRSQNDKSNRIVIIPQGDIRYSRMLGKSRDGHVEVSVDYGSAHRVQAYRVDTLLGRLAANEKVENKLYLAYLHALTSFCLPDQLTKHTGTEEALEILGSASVRAPSRLTKAAQNTLHLLASLAPSRFFYPSRMKVMQKVTWSSRLSFLSQDDRFYKIATEILDRFNSISFLYSNVGSNPSYPSHSEMQLVERAILRTSSQHVSGCGAENFTRHHDKTYISRDSEQTDRGRRVFEAAYCIHKDQATLFEPISSNFSTLVYEMASNHAFCLYPPDLEKSDMDYDSRWLRDPADLLSEYWCRIHRAFQSNQNWLNKYQLIVWISTMSFSDNNNSQITQALLMMAFYPSVSSVEMPDQGYYTLIDGYEVAMDTLEDIGRDALLPFERSPDCCLYRNYGESNRDLLNRQKSSYYCNKGQALSSFVHSMAIQWKCKAPGWPGEMTVENYIEVSTAMSRVYPIWSSWWSNLQFQQYLERITSELRQIPVIALVFPSVSFKPQLEKRIPTSGFVSIDDLFCCVPPTKFASSSCVPCDLIQETASVAQKSKRLTRVLDFLDSKAKLKYEAKYLNELRQSAMSLKDHPQNELIQTLVSKHDRKFRKYLHKSEELVASIYRLLSHTLLDINKAGSNHRAFVVKGSDLIIMGARRLPRVSPRLLLQQLRRSRWNKLSGPWRDAILRYGLAITTLQQARRLKRFQNDPIDLLRELENIGHKSWEPQQHPEWLLLECESEIKIRAVQQQIAEEMIHPPQNKNSVMQLNMGEGKSSVIVPIVATALGDGSKLVRVVVAKPQAKQMYQMLVSKLSGLLNRPVYLMPFSRDVKMNTHRAGAIHSMVAKCMEEGGVLMVQPEHLLSFQLMELECQLSKQTETAESIMETRRLFEYASRDVVDESDENFSVKFELIYTLGQQQPIEHSPDRWAIIQDVLGLIRDCCSELKHEYAQSIEFGDRDGAKFPRIRILRPDAEQAILSRVAQGICEGGMSGFPISHQPPQVRKTVFRYITQGELSAKEQQDVKASPFWVEATKNHILLLRGLFSGGILAFALGQKRWRVNYGLDPNRETKTNLAVPFRAKDSPTPRSEFSHPDVVLVLTCLTYYYGGLDDEALLSSLTLLVRSDSAAQEYQTWVKSAPTLPRSFKDLQGINLRDRVQCITEVFPHLRYSKAAIDYYLSHMVFAKESREFPHKLSSSGWDLGKKKSNPTTGFSGTNDSRYVLPLEIKQLDINEQKHTNALVLEYLLRPENGIALMPEHMGSATFDSESLLQLVSTLGSTTRVIIDAGAQVIDLDNLEFARKWLSRHEDDHTQAAIFFDDLDEIMVLDRSGKVEELQTSPFSDQLDQCLVFLDEAHTRGTDLKLPADYQAAVTLGANLTKDRLVQACMRMRKLGKGQTVAFCIPREIEQKILQLQDDQDGSTGIISASDVLCWVITETWLELRKAVPLWLNQGIRFYQQQSSWQGLTRDETRKNRLKYAEKFKENEAQGLSERYSPDSAPLNISSLLEGVKPGVAKRFERRCKRFGLTELRNNSLQEEQERELSPETEQERQIERPPPAQPATHRLRSSIVKFVTHGLFPEDERSLIPAFKSLSDTSAAKHFDVNEFPHKIWVTGDFATTVKEQFDSDNYSDCFQRPVQWILVPKSRSRVRKLVIISPYEAQELLPHITTSQHVALHLYTPRVNLAFQSLDHLELYSIPKNKQKTSIPRSLITQLNIFAGQLYLSSFEDYTLFCDTLGLAWMVADESVILGPDGFIPPGDEKAKFFNNSGLSKSPVQFFKVFMAKIRQECVAIDKTHVGRILEGERLHENEFEEQKGN